MVDGYFDYDNLVGPELSKKRKRLIAVNAALEVIKSSVGPVGGAASSKVDEDLASAASKLDALVDAIQATLEKQ